MEIKINEIKRSQSVNVLIAILVLGSLWGLSEVVLNGAIRAAGLPFRAGILTGIGIGIMGVAIGIFRKSSILIGIALVAIFCKQLVVPILHVSVMCKVNSCLAVILEGVALTGVVSLAGRKLERGLPAQNSCWCIRSIVGFNCFLLCRHACCSVPISSCLQTRWWTRSISNC